MNRRYIAVHTVKEWRECVAEFNQYGYDPYNSIDSIDSIDVWFAVHKS